MKESHYKSIKKSYHKYDLLWLIVDPQKLFVKIQQTPKPEAHGPSMVPSKAEHSERTQKYLLIICDRKMINSYLVFFIYSNTLEIHVINLRVQDSLKTQKFL